MKVLFIVLFLVLVSIAQPGVAGEAGAISCLYESTKRMESHRKALAPLLVATWIPFLVGEYLSTVAMVRPELSEEMSWIALAMPLLSLAGLAWLFVVLALHAKLRARHRLRAKPEAS